MTRVGKVSLGCMYYNVLVVGYVISLPFLCRSWTVPVIILHSEDLALNYVVFRTNREVPIR